MTRMQRYIPLLVFLALPAAANDVHVIICGSGGEPAYTEKFRGWGERLRTVLIDQVSIPPGQVILLTEPAKPTPVLPASTAFSKMAASDSPLKDADAHASTLNNIRDTFARLAEQDLRNLFVYLIGHGSFRRGISKLNIPGPDLEASELAALLDSVPAERALVVNAASASAGFINALSAEGRAICAATKSTEERNATEFMRFFLQGLEDGSADQNRDERISLLELCAQAAALTQAWYTSEGLIATEHALLDDNGDGLGTRLPVEGTGDVLDGALATTAYVKDYSFPPGVSPELITAYRAALAQVEALTARKVELDESAYFAELERLLVKAARINHEIRATADSL